MTVSPGRALYPTSNLPCLTLRGTLPAALVQPCACGLRIVKPMITTGTVPNHTTLTALIRILRIILICALWMPVVDQSQMSLQVMKACTYSPGIIIMERVQFIVMDLLFPIMLIMNQLGTRETTCFMSGKLVEIESIPILSHSLHA